MKIATWNVNSVKARIPRVLEFLHVHRPDIVCLQETKTTPDGFPRGAFLEAGYAVVDHSAGQWAGVAILAPMGTPIEDVQCGLPGSPLPDEARWIEATIGGVRAISVYVINGRTLQDPMFPLKLEFLEAMLARVRALQGQPLIVAGDFNIAPADVDVYSPAAFAHSTHVTPDERARLRAILDAGLVDAYRHLHPEETQYTWWDYRGGDFHRGLGLRIDLALVSPDLAEALRSCGIDRDFRKGPKPSDHAPLLLDLDR